MSYQIAIDGPAGAGKSTIARALAKDLGLIYVDTGALYRAIGYYMYHNGISIDDDAAVIVALDGLRVSLAHVEGEQHVFVNDEDVSNRIRTPQISMAASKISAIPGVRAFLLNLQRDIAAAHSVVMDGRDIGTVILPNADVKIFLTASPESRAERRYKELVEKGESVTLDAVLADMKKRDYDDAHRAAAPLRKADDAVEVDTSALNLEQSIARMKEVVLENLPK
ncbi:MAG: (d)CMP kinase [Clostridia bacterium]|nr:(d)CMP kinase [Clostridia bacterium]